MQRFVFMRICAFALIATFALVGESSGVTIVVGGHDSVHDPLGVPGVFVTAYLIDPHVVRIPLPGGLPTAAKYKPIEDKVYNIAHAATVRNQSVSLIGYSHGATMVLRIAHRLSDLHLDRLVKLVTIDRIALDYPISLSPHYDYVPDGLISAFNIYQTADSVFKGGAVTGAVNVDATGQVVFEKPLGSIINPTDARFKYEYHHFIQDSDYVRREVLWRFGLKYLPGIWHIIVAGTADGHSIDGTLDYLLYVADKQFEAKAWRPIRNGLSRFIGTIGISSMNGNFVFLTGASDCPSLRENATGTFRGALGQGYNEFDLSLQGEWPFYDSKTCQSTGMRQFSGEAHGSLAAPPLVGESPRAGIADSLGSVDLLNNGSTEMPSSILLH